MALDQMTRERIDSLVRAKPVVLFMKGVRGAPQCGFSARVVQMLDTMLPDYETVDVLADPALREGIKEYSSWPTIPQLYVRGELVGGCDIVSEMYGEGELHRLLGVEVPEVGEPPTLHVSDEAARFIRQVAERQGGGRPVRLTIDVRFRTDMGFDEARATDVRVTANGVDLVLDPVSAPRAEGLRIEAESTPQGIRLRIDNPNDPAAVRSITARELKRLLDEGAQLELLDARTPEEREIAAIERARLLDPQTVAEIEKLDRDRMLVFHCHHGSRSLAAAEHFKSLGFRNLHNLEGGIDAWSRDVDPSVPRY